MRQNQPVVNVGILTAKEIEMVLEGEYTLEGETVTGAVSLAARNVPRPLLFTPKDIHTCAAAVKDVTIGVNFHWERKETQKFAGDIRIVPVEEGLLLINTLPVEDYLVSVISSEMSATSSLPLLCAHAVISRSWLLAQLEHKGKACSHTDGRERSADGTPRRVVWYDHDDHDLFDVCADDHCQRYQGITRQHSPNVAKAIEITRGQVITDTDGSLCDARFSKCCGGIFEEFETCWEDEHKNYLVACPDMPGATPASPMPDLRDEENARRWICSAPPALCNTENAAVLTQVLNDYDQETTHFYRWTVEYGAEELSELVRRRSGFDFGLITDLVPLRRGPSGRLSLLRIVGDKLTMDVGKELEIRRFLSESHLYSSAFVVDRRADGGFILRGAGWGHGVGLCQIGAAVMAEQGHDYKQILAHYYPGSVLTAHY